MFKSKVIAFAILTAIVSSIAIVSCTNPVSSGAAATSPTTTPASSTPTPTPIVTNPVAVIDLDIDKTNLVLNVGENSQITPTIYPNNATNKGIIWTSDNYNIASVSNTGIVNGLSEGNTTVYAKTIDGSFVKSCSVTVNSVKQLHSLSDQDVIDAIAAHDAAISAAYTTSNTNANAYYELIYSPALAINCHFNNYVSNGYTATGSIKITNNIPNTETGTITLTSATKSVTELKYNITYNSPATGTIVFKFTDGTTWTENVGTGAFTQN